MVVMTDPASPDHDNGMARASGTRPEQVCLPAILGHGSTIGVGSVNWAAALEEHRQWLRTVVRARLGESQAVDEVMQDVALAALEQRAPICDQSKVAPWLYRIAVVRAVRYR